MTRFLDFERAAADLEAKIHEIREASLKGKGPEGPRLDEELTRLERRMEATLRKIYGDLTPWNKTQVARHPDRPHPGDYVAGLVKDFVPLAGDRRFGEDPAMLAGLGRFRGTAIAVVGHRKGSDTAERVERRFGMANPEGYRKATRVMDLANRFGLPVLTLVDTPGAYPGVDAENRGQAEAIARSIEQCLALEVPSVSVVTGEGGSGGAVALATANRVMMMEHAIYTVASPEASASILWRDSKRAQEAAAAMRVTAQDLLGAGVVDEVIAEPLGGAHRAPGDAVAATGRAVARAFRELGDWEGADLRRARVEKFRAMGRLTPAVNEKKPKAIAPPKKSAKKSAKKVVKKPLIKSVKKKTGAFEIGSKKKSALSSAYELFALATKESTSSANSAGFSIAAKCPPCLGVDQ